MTDDSKNSEEQEINQGSSKDETPTSIYLISYPKIVFLYPTLFVSLVAAIFMSIAGESAQIGGDREHMAEIMALLFSGRLRTQSDSPGF